MQRPTWSAVGRAVTLALSVATEVVKLIYAIRGGL